MSKMLHDDDFGAGLRIVCITHSGVSLLVKFSPILMMRRGIRRVNGGCGESGKRIFRV
jgi:hypothetical protein